MRTEEGRNAEALRLYRKYIDPGPDLLYRPAKRRRTDLPPEPPAGQKDIYAELRTQEGRNAIADRIEQRLAQRGGCGS